MARSAAVTAKKTCWALHKVPRERFPLHGFYQIAETCFLQSVVRRVDLGRLQLIGSSRSSDWSRDSSLSTKCLGLERSESLQASVPLCPKKPEDFWKQTVIPQAASWLRQMATPDLEVFNAVAHGFARLGQVGR